MRYRFAGVIAIDPNNDQTVIVRSGTGTVHVDEDWDAPVTVYDHNGFPMTTLNTTTEGLFPDFYIDDHPVVGFKTSSGHRFYLRSSTPVPGPAGRPPVAVTAPDGNLMFEYEDGITVPGPVMPSAAELADADFAALVQDDTTATGSALANTYATKIELPALVSAATPVREARLPWVSASHRARMNTLGGLSNGTDTGAMTRVSNVAPYRMTETVVGYSNIYSSGSRETSGANDITVRAAVEYEGLFYPLFRNGQRDIVIAPGAFLEFDPVFVNIPKGATYYVRTLVTVPSGGKFPMGTHQGVASPLGDGVEQGTTVTDKTTAGTVTTSNNYAFGPTSVRTRRLDGTPDLVAIGDSISFGSGDSQDRGMIVRAVNHSLPLRNIGYPGSQVHEFLPRYAGLRLRIAGGSTHWIMLYGTNDISGNKTVDQIKTALTAAWQLGVDLGAEVWAGTLPPRSTSTDAWATVEGQTTATTNAVRVAVNDWIRTLPAPLSGVFEIADRLETSRNSGIWKAGFTTDGVHPNQNGSAEGALAIDVAVFS